MTIRPTAVDLEILKLLEKNDRLNLLRQGRQVAKAVKAFLQRIDDGIPAELAIAELRKVYRIYDEQIHT